MDKVMIIWGTCWAVFLVVFTVGIVLDEIGRRG